MKKINGLLLPESLTPQGTLEGTTAMDLTLRAAAFRSDSPRIRGLTFAAEANAPTKDGTLNITIDYALLVNCTKWVSDTIS